MEVKSSELFSVYSVEVSHFHKLIADSSLQILTQSVLLFSYTLYPLLARPWHPRKYWHVTFG